MSILSKRVISAALTVIMVFSICATWCFAAQTQEEKTAIYFLPSYSATKLYDKETGELAWGDPEYMGNSIFQYAQTGDAAALTIGLDENGNSCLEIDPEKDIESGAYSIEIIKGTGGMSDYIIERLAAYADSISTETNKVDVKFFAYDWRRSVTDAAECLREDIKKNGYTNVSFVCHSAGGLLGAKFIQENNKNPMVKVDKAVTLGTPMQGTYAALVALESGEVDMFLNGINSLLEYGWLGTVGGVSLNLLAHNFFYPWITGNLRNTVLTYEMIPSQSYMDQYPAYIVDDAKGLPVNSEVISDTARFAQVLEGSAGDLNARLVDGNEGYLDFWNDEIDGTIMDVYATIDSYHIAGTGSSTSVSAIYAKNEDDTYSFYGTRKSKDGDGLVSLISALGIYFDESGREITPENYNTFEGVDHMSLVLNETIVDEVIRFLDHKNNKTFVPQSGVLELSSAKLPNSSISDIIEEADKYAETIEVRLSGSVDISIKNPYGEEIGKIVDGVADEFIVKQGIKLEYIDSDTDTLCLYFPDADYQIELIKRQNASTSLVSVIMNALIDNGIINDSAAYEFTLEDNENVYIHLEADYDTGKEETDAEQGTDKETGTESDNRYSTGDATVYKANGESEVKVEAEETKANYVQSLKIDKPNVLMTIDGSESLNAKVYPETAKVIYQSSDESIVSVDELGNIKANSQGCAYITAYSEDGNALQNCYVTVLENLKLALKDDSLLKWGEGFVDKINARTSASNVISNFLSAFVRITDKNGVPFENNNNIIATGCKIQLFYNEKVLDELIAIVHGDADGNGILNSRDVSTAQKHLFEIAVIEEAAYFSAADMNDDGNISSRDIAAMQKIIFA